MKDAILMLVAMVGAGLAQGAGAATPLVDAGWMKANSCQPGVVVLDIRNALDGHSKTDYLRGHIPCAVYSDYMKDGWRSKVGNVPGQMSPVAKLEKLVGGLGIDNDTHVVIYHAGKNALDMGSATRVYWTMKVLGHDNVSILDGGFAAYTADKGNKVERGNNAPKPKTFKANFRSNMIASKDDVKAAMKAGVQLIDNRPHDQFIGVNRHPKAKRNGTIPGSINLPESWLTENNGGKFRDQATLSKLYQIAHVNTDGEEITFCNTGHWASLGWFATSELMGNTRVKLYDGSMVEWSADADAPMQSQVSVQ